MPIQILMPALSPTMTEGTLAKWLKAEGDVVESGDVIAEIETDKATMEVEAVEEGVLGKIIVAEGSEGVAVNAVIALLLEDGEDASALDGAESTAAPIIAAPTAAEPAAVALPTRIAGAPPSTGARLFASPLARRLTQQNNLDLSAISGSGPHGRIVMRDIEASMAVGGAPMAAAAKPIAAAPTPAPATPPVTVDGLPNHSVFPNSAMRKIVARRLSESKQQVPHFYLTVDCELDNLLALRMTLNAKATADGPGAYKLSVNDFIIRAAALALIKVPAANATWTDEAILRFADADISVAVAIDGGLITPVIKTANAKGLVEISTEMKDLAGRARQGKLLPEEYQGGTFTISNLGMFGIREFAAIINPPQGAILAIGAGEQRAVVKDGALAVATMMSCTLSVDHRVVDGAVGAAFLAAFKPLIEDPVTMLL